jgi:hypothetical protein
MVAKKYPREEYPRECASFKKMLRGAKEGRVPEMEWPASTEGFFAFLDHVKPIPKTIKVWSIGRKDHSKGYVSGNVFWQERSENNGEPATRPEEREKARQRALLRWEDEVQAESMLSGWKRPEVRERRRKAAAKALKDPEVRGRMSESIAAARARPEVKDAASEVTRLSWLDPVIRAKRKKKMVLAWKARKARCDPRVNVAARKR